MFLDGTFYQAYYRSSHMDPSTKSIIDLLISDLFAKESLFFSEPFFTKSIIGLVKCEFSPRISMVFFDAIFKQVYHWSSYMRPFKIVSFVFVWVTFYHG